MKKDKKLTINDKKLLTNEIAGNIMQSNKGRSCPEMTAFLFSVRILLRELGDLRVLTD